MLLRAHLVHIAALLTLLTASASAYDPVALTENLTPEQAARYARFDGWLIRGVCGDRHLDLAREHGINTIRGYTINIENGSTRRALDAAHERGMSMIVSEWMPHHGENKGRDNRSWNFDYTENVDERLARFIEKVEAIGDHPAILMWGLGNEVHLDPEYLEYVNLMSRAIHERYPLALTSLTMINAKPEHIERIKAHAPDLDVIGVQSYSPGAVRGGIRNMEKLWGKPYYFSEFNGKGPWNFEKSAWGTPYDNLPAERVADYEACYDAIESAPRCLGSTAFVWGHFTAQRPSYFALLLSPHPTGPEAAERAGLTGYPLTTPYTDVMARRFTGNEPTNRAPLITVLEATDGSREPPATSGGTLQIRVDATDPDNDPLRYTLWIIARKGGRYQGVAGPFNVDKNGLGEVPIPVEQLADPLIMAYAFDGNGAAVSTTIPIGINTNQPEPRE